MPLPLLLALISIVFSFLPFAATTTPPSPPQNLTLLPPSSLPPLPPTTHALLTSPNKTLRAPVRRDNTFVFLLDDIRPSPALQSATRTNKEKETATYILTIACRDYDFASYGIAAGSEGGLEMWRVGHGGVEVGERAGVEGGRVGVRVLKGREFYEGRAGFSPLNYLKNPMILIAIVGLAFVFGMPYLLDNMDPETKAEFEEQQKKSILSGGAATPNPLQDFDVAAWMAGKTGGGAGKKESVEGREEGMGGGGSDRGGGVGGGAGSKARRRG
ncbi:hypothetical protein MMC21_008054 [Puttea exsequens]|nr:hypothetical protein [Puttea exsequens]